MDETIVTDETATIQEPTEKQLKIREKRRRKRHRKQERLWQAMKEERQAVNAALKELPLFSIKPPLPMKIDIKKDLFTYLERLVKEKKLAVPVENLRRNIQRFLHSYVQSEEYRFALVSNRVRYDMAGRAYTKGKKGIVTNEHIKGALKALRRIDAARKEKAAAAAASAGAGEKT